jgi:hypothetical protein
MASMVSRNGDVFESGCDLIDVTSLHRPDTSWRIVDAAGHAHRWYANGQPADTYRPEATYDVPTLRWVHDDWGYFEDGERYEIGHHECRDCGEHIEPRSRADDCTQMIPGPRWFTINGEPVSPEEFKRRFESAQ